MNPTSKSSVLLSKSVVVPASVVAALGVVIAVWHFTHKPVNPLVPTSTQNVADFDHFQQDLASRVLSQFGSGGNFSVVVATTAYPLGTLLRSSGSVPANLEDCVPATPPKPLAAQHLFPSYTMSSDTALAANIGSGALQGLDSAGVNFKQSQEIQYTIADTEIQIMDDKSVEEVTGQGNCGKYIAGHPGMRLIRGTVLGKMTFTVKVDNPATVKAQLAKIGGFSVNDNPGTSTLSVADNEREPIVELLSEFSAAPPGPVLHTAPTPVQMRITSGQLPVLDGNGAAHMFIQMDAQDDAATGAKVVQLLHTDWPSANVEPQVQRLPTEKMPATAQVRYFNEGDVALANRCAGILRKDFPDVRVVRVGLSSPKGQLEVWLPKKRA